MCVLYDSLDSLSRLQNAVQIAQREKPFRSICIQDLEKERENLPRKTYHRVQIFALADDVID